MHNFKVGQKLKFVGSDEITQHCKPGHTVTVEQLIPSTRYPYIVKIDVLGETEAVNESELEFVPRLNPIPDDEEEVEF